MSDWIALGTSLGAILLGIDMMHKIWKLRFVRLGLSLLYGALGVGVLASPVNARPGDWTDFRLESGSTKNLNVGKHFPLADRNWERTSTESVGVPSVDQKETRSFTSTLSIDRNGASTFQFHDSKTGVELRIDNAVGGEVTAPDRHLFGGGLKANEAWRKQIDMQVAPQSFDQLGLVLKAGTFSTRRPSRASRKSRYGVGDISRWQENESWNLGLNFKAFDGAMRYSGGVSGSRYRIVEVSRDIAVQDYLYPDKPWRSGHSHWHNVEADLLKSPTASASFYLTVGYQEPDYRSFHHRSDSPLYMDGRNLAVGGNVRHGKLQFKVDHNSADGPELFMRESQVSISLDSVRVGFSDEHWVFHDSELPDFEFDDRQQRASLAINLKKLSGNSIKSNLIPTEIGFFHDISRNNMSNLGVVSDSQRTRFGSRLSWTGSRWGFDLTFARYEQRELDNFDIQPRYGAGLTVDATNYISGNDWDLSFYVSYNDRKTFDQSDSLFGGGASFSLDKENLPEISIGLDFNHFDYRTDLIGFRDREWSGNASIDFAKFLPSDGIGKEPYLKLKAYTDWANTEFIGELRESSWEPTVMMVFGTKF